MQSTIKFVQLYRLQELENGNYRQNYDPDLVTTIADSIARHGFKPEYPISVYESGDRFTIIDGHTRYKACVQAGYTVKSRNFGVWIVVKPEPTGKDFKLAQLAANELRSDPDDISKAIGYQQAIDQGATIDDLIVATGHKRPYVEDRLLLLKLVPEAQDLVAKRHLGIKFAAQLTRLDTNFQRIALQAYTAMKSPSLDEFIAVVNQLYTKQSQCSLFDLALFNGQPIEQILGAIAVERPKTRQELIEEIEALNKAREADRNHARRKFQAALREIESLKKQLATAKVA